MDGWRWSTNEGGEPELQVTQEYRFSAYAGALGCALAERRYREQWAAEQGGYVEMDDAPPQWGLVDGSQAVEAFVDAIYVDGVSAVDFAEDDPELRRRMPEAWACAARLWPHLAEVAAREAAGYAD
jgi:hypothetical protein